MPARETREEACAEVEARELFMLISVPHINQVHLMYRAHLLAPDIAPGEESLEVGWFGEHEIPWEALAFRTVEVTLRHYFADRRQGRFTLHCCDLRPHDGVIRA